MFNLLQPQEKTNADIIYTLEETKKLINLNFVKNNKFMVPRTNSPNAASLLVKSIYEHTKQYKKITLLIRCKFICGVLFKNKIECQSCGNEVLLYGYKLGKYCGDINCLRKIQSNSAKNRGSWMMHTSEAKEKKRISLTGRKLSEENKRKIGESNARKWTDEYKKLDREYRMKLGCDDKISHTMKRKILNGEFTPKSENRKRSKRIKSIATGINYRSNWELIFHEAHPNLEYESIRMRYIENDIERIYITDFVDHKNRIVYEIKPTSQLSDSNFIIKKKFAEKWCVDNDYTYKIITEKDYNFYAR